MKVYVVTSQTDYDPTQIEGIWASKEDAFEWIRKMYDSMNILGDDPTNYYIDEYTVN
jgi:hypothetical protein